ncbi:MAG: NAD(P)-dependent glycerol-3-phosphate dehydrogenase [Coriobacteriia bacterium]|nr:NAD(P)-dependent glycerol-3-phosphate dehydrogenase [Coriobacteriia bacterium]
MTCSDAIGVAGATEQADAAGAADVADAVGAADVAATPATAPDAPAAALAAPATPVNRKVAVIGAGSWGSAVAWLLGNKGISVTIWARDPALVESINSNHRNLRYLTDLVFPDTVKAESDLKAAVADAEAVVLVTPSNALAEVGKKLKPLLAADVPVIILSKGLDPERGALLHDKLGQIIKKPNRIAVLSGPNHAEEVCREIPAAAVVASDSESCALYFQELMGTPTFRIYTSTDTVGVQLCGAAKNVIAIACGLAAGLGFGDNTAALLMTRGLAEIARLVEAVGGDPLTCMGLAGMGDLVATCTSQHSRNRSFGYELAQGGSLEAYQARTHMVVEGALAARTVARVALRYGVEMPICEQVNSIIWDNQPLDEALSALVSREYKPEFY